MKIRHVEAYHQKAGCLNTRHTTAAPLPRICSIVQVGPLHELARSIVRPIVSLNDAVCASMCCASRPVHHLNTACFPVSFQGYGVAYPRSTLAVCSSISVLPCCSCATMFNTHVLVICDTSDSPCYSHACFNLVGCYPHNLTGVVICVYRLGIASVTLYNECTLSQTNTPHNAATGAGNVCAACIK